MTQALAPLDRPDAVSDARRRYLAEADGDPYLALDMAIIDTRIAQDDRLHTEAERNRVVSAGYVRRAPADLGA